MKMKLVDEDEVLPIVVYPNITIHIGDVNRRLYDKDEFYSNSFYLDNPGYKAQLVVDFHEDYVSVFNRFVSGHDDHEIEWPFEGKITIELVNGNGGPNYWKTICYDENTDWRFKVLRYHSSRCYGKREFIAVRKFLSYVRNDRVKFVVTKAEYFK